MRGARERKPYRFGCRVGGGLRKRHAQLPRGHWGRCGEAAIEREAVGLGDDAQGFRVGIDGHATRVGQNDA